ncbi:hypothetical protein [Bacillus sp. COPE52]|uniref:hypothetical protein n=1 Tax=Bacillus sp. COPE52 TaxID=2233998 RepID=UPI000E10C8B8|nr:hypothetical protein [Bacillus sp. COPE52]AXK19153.1 hypothetical protein DPQ31_16215 [Bacillus sp. COPE52]
MVRTHLLSSTDTMIFKPALAEQLGLNEAIVLQQVHYWIEKSNHYHDGRYWVYNTIEKWNEQFQWWGKSTIKRLFGSLEKDGYLLSGNYNKAGFDRTKWYSIDYERLTYASVQNEPMEEVNMNQCKSSKWTNGTVQNELLQEVNMNLTIPETTQRLPENTTDTKNNSIANAEVSSKLKKKAEPYSPEFIELWEIYPRKQDKKAGFREYKEARSRNHSHDVIAYGIQQYVKECETKRTEVKYIKKFYKFLQDERYLEYRRMEEAQKKVEVKKKENELRLF